MSSSIEKTSSGRVMTAQDELEEFIKLENFTREADVPVED